MQDWKVPMGTPPGDTDGFELFFSAYPLHVSKQDTQRVWNQLNPDPALRETILSAIEKEKRCDQWSRDGAGSSLLQPTGFENTDDEQYCGSGLRYSVLDQGESLDIPG